MEVSRSDGSGSSCCPISQPLSPRLTTLWDNLMVFMLAFFHESEPIVAAFASISLKYQAVFYGMCPRGSFLVVCLHEARLVATATKAATVIRWTRLLTWHKSFQSRRLVFAVFIVAVHASKIQYMYFLRNFTKHASTAKSKTFSVVPINSNKRWPYSSYCTVRTRLMNLWNRLIYILLISVKIQIVLASLDLCSFFKCSFMDFV